MRMLSVVLSMGAVGIAAIGCQTITEELPTQPEVVTTGSQFPQSAIVVVPVNLPSPTAPTPAPAEQNPAPAPTPRTAPTAQPGGGGGGGGGGGQIPDNNSQATKLGAKVFFVECNGAQVADSEFATTATVGCRVHLDVTPKDASNSPTRVSHTPHWTFSNEGIIRVGNRDDFTPAFVATGAGTVSCYAQADGITSNTVTIRLQ